jgi:hypothetical protein
MASQRGEIHVVHASLWRLVVLGGAESGFVIMEVATVLALLFVVRGRVDVARSRAACRREDVTS